jgi:predicted esterase
MELDAVRARALLAAVTGICVMLGAAHAAEWPPPPPEDGPVAIAAQEWPREPGPRAIKVHLRYPGGTLANVGGRTGIFLTLHNWGGHDAAGAPAPRELADRLDVVAVSVDYLQSGTDWRDTGHPYDFGYLQALDALRGLCYTAHALDAAGIAWDRGRIFATGGSGGGNVALMANKLAPRTFACVVDLCGMAKLSDDIAFGLNGGSRLDAGYSPDPESPAYLNGDARAIRFVGHPEHARVMKTLGNAAKLVVVHGVEDDSCPFPDAREMAENLTAAGLDLTAHFITPERVDGKIFTTAGHALGDRTAIVFEVAGQLLDPGIPEAVSSIGPADFDLRDESVRYPAPGGDWVISYAEGYPVGRFERRTAP